MTVRLGVIIAILNQSNCDHLCRALTSMGLGLFWFFFFFLGAGHISQDYVSTLAADGHRWQHCWWHNCF